MFAKLIICLLTSLTVCNSNFNCNLAENGNNLIVNDNENREVTDNKVHPTKKLSNKSEIKADNDLIEKGSKPSFDNSLIDDSSYEIIEESTEKNIPTDVEYPITPLSNDDIKDEYEYNDTIETAKVISPNYTGSVKPQDYTVSINATIHQNEEWFGLKKTVDKDYYRFDIYGKADVNVFLYDIPENCDYDLILYKHNNVAYSKPDSITKIDSSPNESNLNEEMNNFLYPGVYYIYVFAYEDKTFNANEKHCLSLKVDYQSEDMSISDLRYNKDVGAALWVSDYDPFDIKPFTLSNKEEIGMYQVTLVGVQNSFANPIFNYIFRFEKILHASLYIWNFELRSQLYLIVKKSISLIQNELNSNAKIRAEFKFVEEFINDESVVTSIILTFTDTAYGVASIVIQLVNALLPTVARCITETIMPESKIETASNYLNYLQVLAAALECNSSTNSQEIIKIDSYYNIDSEWAIPAQLKLYYLNFSPVMQDNYLYDDDKITAFTNDSYFSGTIYPLKTDDDIKNAREKNANKFDDVNTGGDTEIFLDNAIPGQIGGGNYYWYHFIAPETATYEFYTNSSIDTVGELYPKIVLGTSTQERIAYNDDSGDSLNFSIEYNMAKGRKIYLKVRGFSLKTNGIYSLSVRKSADLNEYQELIKGEDLNFENEYVDAQYKEGFVLDDGFTFTTQRLRCGYINKQYLALSAKCKNAGTAYLQMDFLQDIYGFDFSLAIWSEEEYLNSNSTIVLETNNGDGYQVFYTFNIAEMSKNKDVLDSYSFIFPEVTYGIRIKVVTNQVNYEKNKGRVVIGDMVVHHL